MAVSRSVSSHLSSLRALLEIALGRNHPQNLMANDKSVDITDQVAKESKDSTASTHKLHQDAHAANLGPVKTDNLPEPASKEELKKKSEELNK